MTTRRARLQVRHGPAAEWTASNRVLLDGEWGFESDTGLTKIGDGTTAWTQLSYTTVREVVDLSITNTDIATNAGIEQSKVALAITDAEVAADAAIDQAKIDGLVSGAILCGSGTPENAVAAPVGVLFLRNDGGAGTTLYVKESGTGDTGWVGK